MITIAVEMLVCVGLIAWLLSQKRGEKFSANFVLKLILAGMLPVVIPIALDGVLPDTSAIPPLLYGFLKALLLAACVEELLIYLAFRVAIRGSGEVKSVHDAVLAACVVNMGFVLLDDILYTVIGAQVMHVTLLTHLIFGTAMGYFYGKAKAAGKIRYHVLAVCVPILGHTLLDMCPYAMRASAGTGAAETYYHIALAVDALFAVLLVVSLVLIVRWGKNPKLCAAPGEGGLADGAAAQKKGSAYANPESLDDYIRVTSPPVWATLIGMAVLIVGIFAWASLGRMQTTVQAGAIAEDGTLTCYVPLNYVSYLNDSSTISVSGQTLRCSGAPVRTVQTTSTEAKLLAEHGIDPASVAAVELPASVDDGLYRATVVVETISPLKLILG